MVKVSYALCLIYFLGLFPVPVLAQWNITDAMNSGKSALELREYDAAIMFFNRIIDCRPTYHQAFYYRGLAKYAIGEYEDAEADMTSVINLNHFYYEAYEIRGNARIHMSLYNQASHDFGVCTSNIYNRMDLWYKLSMCLLKSGEFDLAEAQSDSIIRKWPKSANGYLCKARVRYRKNDFSSTNRYIDEALRVEPYNIEALTVKANLLMSQSIWHLSEEIYTKALHVRPDYALNLLCRGMCKAMQGKIKEAETDFRLAADISKDSPLVNQALSITNIEEAKSLIDIFIKQHDFMMAFFNF